MSDSTLDTFVNTPVFLAPMAGISDVVMRKICTDFGADLTYCEMVSAKGLSYSSEKTRALLNPIDENDKFAVQIFGHEPSVMKEEASWIEDVLKKKLVLIDINMGCPARKIIKKQDGSALMENPKLAAEIVSSVKSAVKSPVTCKFRRGVYIGDETAPEFAKAMEAAGADAVCIHGRFARQMYSGNSDLGVIKRVKDAVAIPVIGNGDIRSGKDALRMLDVTACDALMIARGAIGNPWIFQEVKAALSGIESPDLPDIKTRMDQAARHARMLCEMPSGAHKMRRHAMAYVAGLPGAARARGMINRCECADDFEEVFRNLADYSQMIG